MNLCFVIGKVSSNIEFNFLYNSSNISISKCYIELSNNSKIQIICYNNIEDYLYSKIKVKDIVFVEGILLENKIEVKVIETL